MFRYFAISICVISWSTRRSSNRLKYMESPRKSCYHLVTFSCDSSPIRLNFCPLYDIVCHLAMEEFFTLSAAQRKGTILDGRMAPFQSPKTARAAPLTCHCPPLQKRCCTRCAKDCLPIFIAAFDLACAYVRLAATAAGFREKFSTAARTSTAAAAERKEKRTKSFRR